MAGVTYSNRLEDQAASTALNSHKDQPKSSILDEDGKLSSASAATSLKYAQAQDLPSFPSAGLKLSSAGAAASLADSNKKSFEHWKPGSIPAANRAAVLAKDYEMDPLWQPELSAAGSKAALLAHRDTPSVDIWKSQATEQGQSAAGQALKVKSPNAITERDVPPDAHRKALLAATGAMAGNRPRSGSVPVSKGETQSWALRAATKSHKGAPNTGPFASGDPGFEAARIQNVAKNNVNRQLYGSNPPVAIEVEEKNRQDMLRASAVAMAKKMYAIQQTHIDEAAGVRRSDSKAAATSSHQRNLSDNANIAAEEAVATPRYENLEEAARRLAQERLAKMRDEHAEYRQYYGQTSQAPRSRLSVRLGRRASVGAKADDSSDEEQSRRIRRQMSGLQSKVAEVDKKKQQADRDALLVAAHRNVEARMAKMDEQVFQQTGKASPAQTALWEQQAREKAQKSVDAAMQNVGKVHIGGGKYLDQAEVDAIAKARLQPTLDEINDTAEKQRARDAEIRLEHDRAQEQLAKERAREAETKAEVKAAVELERLEAKRKKEEEKQAQKEQAAAEKERLRKEKEERQAVVAQEKEKARLEKEQSKADAAEKARVEREEKRKSAEIARQEKEDKQKSAEAKPGRFNSILKRRGKDAAPAEEEAVTTTEADTAPVTAPLEGETVHDQVTQPATAAPVAPVLSSQSSESSHTKSIQYEDTVPGTLPVSETPVSPTKRDNKVKTWFKSRLGGANKKEEATGEPKSATSEDVDKPRDESIRDVAMAGRETDDLYGSTSREERPVSPVREADEARASRSKASSVSSYSHDAVIEEARPLSGTEHTAQVGRTGLKAKLLKKIKPNKDEPTQPARQSFGAATTDDEEFEEAKDKLEDDKLPLPPTLSSNRPASPRASHEQSKFKEEL